MIPELLKIFWMLWGMPVVILLVIYLPVSPTNRVILVLAQALISMWLVCSSWTIIKHSETRSRSKRPVQKR